MRRLVSLWLALLAAFWLARAAASSLLFGRVDQGYGALLELLAIPALQAVALGWLTRQPGPLDLALPWRQAWRLRPLRGALALDAAILAAAWLLPAYSWPSWLTASSARDNAAMAGMTGSTGPASLAGWPALAALAASAKLLAAAALLVIALGRPGWSTRDRVAVGAFGAMLPVLAAAPWTGWPAALPGLLAAPPRLLTALPRLLATLPSPALGWFIAYGTLLAAALLLALPAAAALRRHSQAAAMALDWALALLLTAAALAVLGFARQPPSAATPWNRAAAALASLGATALLVGGALATFPRPAAARTARPDAESEIDGAGEAGAITAAAEEAS